MTVQQVIDYVDNIETFLLVGILLVIIALWRRIIALLTQSLGIDDIKRDNIRTRLLFNMALSPDNIEAICEDYDLYKKSGGNGYIDKIFSEWNLKTEAGKYAGIDRRRRKTDTQEG